MNFLTMTNNKSLAMNNIYTDYSSNTNTSLNCNYTNVLGCSEFLFYSISYTVFLNIFTLVEFVVELQDRN